MEIKILFMQKTEKANKVKFGKLIKDSVTLNVKSVLKNQ